jgi:LuxR family maltose regulon positive regulatory protein
VQRGAATLRPRGAEVVAATKIDVPVLHEGLVAREGLVRALMAEPRARLTLVSAPAGSGKTTLVVQWVTSPEERRPAAWLSLDPEDNDPVRFWAGVIAALGRVHPGVGDGAAAALRAPGTGLTTVVLPLLVNDLARLDEPVVLVLDDLHVIAADQLLRSLAFLVDRAPAMLHVAVTTRADPPLPLARLRARGELVEVRAADLRFNDVEATAMLGGLGLDLVAGEMAELQLRTEGWAAGLQLAGLSLRSRPATADRVAVLRGDAAHIVDYLTEEVLDAQAPEIRDFLMRTSVLDRMTGDLCDALVDGGGSADRLDALDAANLFLVALDPAREWFRYHHLFCDVLRRRLRREAPGLETALHRRAAAWLAEHRMAGDAIRHALAGDAEHAAGLIGAHWRAFFNRGELATVSDWLARLPRDVVDADARLWLAKAWIALDRGRLEEVSALLAFADDGGSEEHRAWAAVLRAVHAFKAGDVATAGALVRDARASVPRPDDFWRAVAAVIAGAVAYWGGGDAQRELQEALSTAAADGNQLGQLYALGYLSRACGEAGDAAAAAARLAEADALLDEDPALSEHFVALTVELARSARPARGPHARRLALRDAERALELARRGAGRLEVAECLRAVAQAAERVGDARAARRALAEAREFAAACPDPARLAERLRLTAAGISEDHGLELREPLSERELGVLRLLPSGLSQRQIGAELFVSVNTVKSHVKSIFRKLRVGSRDEAVSRARELGLL